MIKGILKIIYYALITVIVGIALLLIISIFPTPGNYQVKVVLSGSMEPSIKTGSIVIIKAQDTYKIGDVITFGKDTKKEIPVTHRILDKSVTERPYNYITTYITKGDANKDTDPNVVRKTDVIGKVLFSIPYVGFLLDFTKKPIGFLSLVIIPASIIAIGEIVKIIKTAKDIRRKKYES